MIKWKKLTLKSNERSGDFDNELSMFNQPGSPFGQFADDDFHPLNMFNLYILKTDFSITKSNINELSVLDGIELLNPISKYQLTVGIGELFNDEYIKQKIESILCGTNQDILDIESITDQDCKKEAVNIREELKSFYKYWAMLVYPNGVIDKVYSDDEQDFTERLNEMEELKNVSGGKIIKYSNTENTQR